MQFFFEVLIGGLLSGVMYALVALGVVLIYKASGVFNFAQGAMVFFAALTFVGVMELGAPFGLALVITFAAMVLLGVATEKVVLRPLVNQPQITLFMPAGALAVELILHRKDRHCAGGEGSLERDVNVRSSNGKNDRRFAGGLRTGVVVGKFFRQHYHTAEHFDFRVRDSPFLIGEPKALDGVKRLSIKLNRLVCVANGQHRCDGRKGGGQGNLGKSYFVMGGSQTSTDIPGRSRPRRLSRETLIRTTCLERSSIVCTLLGVNSAWRATNVTRPVKVSPG